MSTIEEHAHLYDFTATTKTLLKVYRELTRINSGSYDTTKYSVTFTEGPGFVLAEIWQMEGKSLGNATIIRRALTVALTDQGGVN